MSKVPVSIKLFAMFAEWALSQPNAEALSEGAESWHDAPYSGEVRGMRALLYKGDKYNRIGMDAYNRFLEATGTEVVMGTVFSDRTGDHPCIRLKVKA